MYLPIPLMTIFEDLYKPPSGHFPWSGGSLPVPIQWFSVCIWYFQPHTLRRCWDVSLTYFDLGLHAPHQYGTTLSNAMENPFI